MERKPHPPKMIERIASILIPSTSREQVLGDLHERYRSPFHYILDVVRTAPFVMASQVRRKASFESILRDALAVWISFRMAVVWSVGRSSPGADPSLWLPLAIPIAVAVLALLLRDAYAGNQKTTGVHAFRDGLFAVPCALLSQPLLAVAGFDLLLPRQSLVVGGILSLFALRFVRRSHGWDRDEPIAFAGAASLSLADLGRRAREFQTTVRNRNVIECVVSLILALILGARILTASNLVFGFGCALIVAGIIYISIQRYRKAWARPLPADANSIVFFGFHRSELERQRDAMQSRWAWGVVPLVPGLTLVVAAFAMRGPTPSILVLVCFMAGVFFLAFKQLNWKANQFQKEIDALDALAGESD